MDWISSMLLATVRLAIPLLLISLAELYGQRAGMVNIGLEGLAAIGALVGALGQQGGAGACLVHQLPRCVVLHGLDEIDRKSVV